MVKYTRTDTIKKPDNTAALTRGSEDKWRPIETAPETTMFQYLITKL